MSTVSESTTITPASTARPNIRGTPVTLSDGNTWILADTVAAWGPLWDQLYDQNVIRRKYEPEHILIGALSLLIHNYSLTTEQAGNLILGGDLKGMKLAMERAMFSPARPQWTYSDWVLSSLAANGLKVEDIPDGLLHAVLSQLVQLKRAVPEGQFIASAQRASRKGKFFALARQQAAQRTAAAAAAEVQPEPQEPQEGGNS